MSLEEICTNTDSRTIKVKKVITDLTEEEEKDACEAFTLLDEDGDGMIDLIVLEDLLISWGRLPMDDEIIEIMSYAQEGIGNEEGKEMNYEGFLNYLKRQLNNTSDEEELRRAFQVFDSCPPTGKLDLTELRHYLKKTGLKLTDDEIDFLYREEDYWMLEEKNKFEYEELIKKILNTSDNISPFLNY